MNSSSYSRWARNLAALAGVLVSWSAMGHSVWIEPDDSGQLIVRFAEPDGGFETSPGHLDSLSPPVGAVFKSKDAPEGVEMRKERDRFTIEGARADAIACVETSFTVMGSTGRPGRKPNFYARWHPAGGVTPEPALNLDLVPTGKPGEVRAYFRGKPLGGVMAILRLPNEHEEELTADAEGFIRFKTPQSGFYLLRIARHREALPGFHLGRPYELTSHNASLTWRQP